MSVILTTQEAKIRRTGFKASPSNFTSPYLKNTQYKKGPVKWLRW
jgi:hypothetical protein